jgi:hypothetical protein
VPAANLEEPPMRQFHRPAIAVIMSAAALAFMTGPSSAQAPQGQPPQAQAPKPATPATPKPYTAVAVTPPAASTDASFEAFRKQLADIVKRKDRAGLGRLVVAQGFFWEREGGDGADKKKSGLDNLAAAIGLDAKEGFGWDMLGDAADDPTLETSPERTGVMCSPANPKFDDKAFEQLTKTTGTEEGDWAFPVSDNVEVHGGPQPNAPVIGKLGLNLVWVLPDEQPPAAAGNARNNPPPPPTAIKIVLPSGKIGYVAIDAIAPIGAEQLCYIKDGSNWKIAGFIGGEQ